jgi:hypothetical protein
MSARINLEDLERSTAAIAIAGCSPTVMNALIARIRELESYLGLQCDRLDAFHETYTKVAQDPLNVREIIQRGVVLP